MPRVSRNKNTEWLDNHAFWLFYVLLIALSWLIISCWTDPGIAWTYVHIGHGLITYYLLHWTKGSPITDDQGKYDRCGCHGDVGARFSVVWRGDWRSIGGRQRAQADYHPP